ncbi:fungal-specific transcription factor domain-containing protein [Aspergillus californicus]
MECDPSVPHVWRLTLTAFTSSIRPEVTNCFRPARFSFLDSVESRLASVERDVRVLKNQRPILSPVSALSCEAGFTEGTTLRNNPDAPMGTDDGAHTMGSADATDGIGTIEFSNEEDSAYFGPSSNIAFTRHIRRVAAFLLRDHHPLHATDTSSHAHPSRLAVSRPQSPVSRGLSGSWMCGQASDAFRLPPGPEVRRLSRHFFSDTGHLFPYIFQAGFWTTYEAAEGSGFKEVRPSWLGLLNMILAMAISTFPDPRMRAADRAAHSDVYFDRAKTLCLNHMMTGASVETVQVMLLMSQYLQGTQRPTETWTIHGLAVKAAFQLGLHSMDAVQHFDPMEREDRIRTWYGCIVLDRTLSMTFGRPPSIPENYVRVPLPSHLILHNYSNDPWSTEEDSTKFWTSTITLYQIMYRVIDSLYGCNISFNFASPLADIASSIIEIEQQLTAWQAALPQPLKLVDADDLQNIDDVTLLDRLQVILTLQFHNLCILAHRPILDRYLQRLDGSSVAAHEAGTLWQVGHRSKSICLQSSKTIISIVNAITTSSGPRRGMLGAWWFTLYYTFNAALTIVGILLSEDDDTSCWDQQLYDQVAERQRNIVDQAIACIPLLDNENRMAEKCAKFMSALRYCIQNFALPHRNGISNFSNVGSVANISNGPVDRIASDSTSTDYSIHPALRLLDFPPPEGGGGLSNIDISDFNQFLTPDLVHELSTGDLFL